MGFETVEIKRNILPYWHRIQGTQIRRTIRTRQTRIQDVLFKHEIHQGLHLLASLIDLILRANFQFNLN